MPFSQLLVKPDTDKWLPEKKKEPVRRRGKDKKKRVIDPSKRPAEKPKPVVKRAVKVAKPVKAAVKKVAAPKPKPVAKKAVKKAAKRPVKIRTTVCLDDAFVYFDKHGVGPEQLANYTSLRKLSRTAVTSAIKKAFRTKSIERFFAIKSDMAQGMSKSEAVHANPPRQVWASKQRSVRAQQAKGFYASGIPVSDIAKTLKVKPNTVYKYLEFVSSAKRRPVAEANRDLYEYLLVKGFDRYGLMDYCSDRAVKMGTVMGRVYRQYGTCSMALFKEIYESRLAQ